MKTHYDSLEVSENASAEEIKRAYRLRMQRCHPDKNLKSQDQAERLTREIREAYEVLSNRERRQKYDAKIGAQRDFDRHTAMCQQSARPASGAGIRSPYRNFRYWTATPPRSQPSSEPREPGATAAEPPNDNPPTSDSPISTSSQPAHSWVAGLVLALLFFSLTWCTSGINPPVHTSAQPFKPPNHESVGSPSTKVHAEHPDPTNHREAFMVKEVQRNLNLLGFNAGPVDGILGPQTENAIRQFQALHGLPVNGLISNAIRGRMSDLLPSRSKCQFKPVMADRDYHACGLEPPHSGWVE